MSNHPLYPFIIIILFVPVDVARCVFFSAQTAWAHGRPKLFAQTKKGSVGPPMGTAMAQSVASGVATAESIERVEATPRNATSMVSAPGTRHHQTHHGASSLSTQLLCGCLRSKWGAGSPSARQNSAWWFSCGFRMFSGHLSVHSRR